MKRITCAATLVLLVCFVANCPVANAENDNLPPKRAAGKMRNSIVRLGKRDDIGDVAGVESVEAQPDQEMPAEIKRSRYPGLSSGRAPAAWAAQDTSVIWKNTPLKRMLRAMYLPFPLKPADEISVERVPSWLENMANYRHTASEN